MSVHKKATIQRGEIGKRAVQLTLEISFYVGRHIVLGKNVQLLSNNSTIPRGRIKTWTRSQDGLCCHQGHMKDSSQGYERFLNLKQTHLPW